MASHDTVGAEAPATPPQTRVVRFRTPFVQLFHCEDITFAVYMHKHSPLRLCPMSPPTPHSCSDHFVPFQPIPSLIDFSLKPCNLIRIKELFKASRPLRSVVHVGVGRPKLIGCVETVRRQSPRRGIPQLDTHWLSTSITEMGIAFGACKSTYPPYQRQSIPSQAPTMHSQII